ncbi:hypothetical protein G6F64_015166 [Rhizopus arrhizus]|uniref:Uncharacterized protein n=1 Tax=Rhizopus oryzae TaxID=64495 RepID=A0A9P7BIS9_RHIOR|nr:hypothetical protein G6F64_015166 [Rhizopus arrhizus]KAG1476708.1 hypothetical protein G6F54_014137 [Rhizopus delemar]
MAGTPLSEPLALRRLATRTSMDNKTVTLSWVRVGEPDGEIVISRDGAEVARLPGTATEYADTGFTARRQRHARHGGLCQTRGAVAVAAHGSDDAVPV